ncbi:MAG TPA: SDR family oxidoreductase [Candidatus Acidoferrum sp.]|nr:SDR family oxidoreductase [Candidatus Acidoferrum sp.]
MILITGASGSVGREVLREMQKTGEAVCAMYRSKEDEGKAPAGVKTVIADFSDTASLLKALQGVERVYLVCSPIQELVELEGNAIDACKRAGVRTIVLNSALGAGDYDKSFPSWHRKVEDKLKASGMAWTILRPNGFMQNTITYLAPSIRAQGVFYDAMSGAKTSYIDVRDVAAVAAKALTSAGHDGKTYELNGPEAITQDDLAKRIAAKAGRDVKHVNIPREAHQKAMLDLGMPEWQVKALIELQDYYVSGRAAAVDGVVAKLLGRPERTIDAFLTENAAEFRA